MGLSFLAGLGITAALLATHVADRDNANPVVAQREGCREQSSPTGWAEDQVPLLHSGMPLILEQDDGSEKEQFLSLRLGDPVTEDVLRRVPGVPLEPLDIHEECREIDHWRSICVTHTSFKPSSRYRVEAPRRPVALTHPHHLLLTRPNGVRFCDVARRGPRVPR